MQNSISSYNQNMLAKPFVKWAGGKSQILDEIERNLPREIKVGKIEKYFEPFIGGGAVFLYLSQRYPIKQKFISDNNPELILLYRVIKENVDAIINELSSLKEQFLLDDDEERRKKFYYEVIRKSYNLEVLNIDYDKVNSVSIKRAAKTLFLNRTCYNGLFRVNKAGKFNVPYGKYSNPFIYESYNLRKVSKILKDTIIKHGEFKIFTNQIDKNSFVYFDPPYRPLNKTANFTAYTGEKFDHFKQIELAEYFNFLNKRGAKLLLSNSDVSKKNKPDMFYDEYYDYKEKNYVLARRNINRNGFDRGKIKEVLLRNYLDE